MSKQKGPRYAEFDTLYQNMKSGLVATKELCDFLKERTSVEESYSKSLLKLAKLAANANVNSTFAPYWTLLKLSSEKLSSIHLATTQRFGDLVKELQRYGDELQKKHKTVKDAEQGTMEVVTQIQTSTQMTMKSKEVYVARQAEWEKAVKDGASQKEVEKAEGKAKKAQEEYKVWVDKYQQNREEYQTKMPQAWRRFEEVEQTHIRQMQEYVVTYGVIMEQACGQVDEISRELREECNLLTVEKLMEGLKERAIEKDEPAVLVEVNEVGMGNGGELIPGLGSGGGGAIGDDRSLNGQSDKYSTTTSGSSLAAQVLEKKREGEGASTVVGVEGEMVRQQGQKGGRRTTSLLNLFIPLSQGSKSNSAAGNASVPKVSAVQGLSDSPNYDPNNDPSKSSLSRSSNNRGSKCPESTSGPVVRVTVGRPNGHSPATTASTSETQLTTKVLGFLRSRRGKKKEKKRKKKEGSGSGKDDKSDGDEKDSSQKSETPTAEIDEEGYSVPPKSTWDQDKSSFYSSSDTDSDSDREKRLHIEIKPLSNGTAPLSASVDELRTTVENLTLSPAGPGGFCNTLKSRKLLHEADSQMKRSQSVSQQIGSSSPPSRHPYTPLSPPIPPPNPRSSPKLPEGAIPTSTASSATSRYADLGDLFSEPVRNTPTPTTTTSIPRPPSRPRPEARTSTASPSPAISRTESIGSLERSMIPHLGSRGPSPLTIGMADTIPLAVAFHEIVHASFKGNDESLCQVRMTGDMMVSFPAGIIQVFANNPSPAQLTFTVRSAQPLDSLVSNKELVTVTKGDDASLTFEFQMSALVALLKNHAEQNSSASYFNIDILKYQITPKSGAASCPLHLVAFWKCEPTQTDLRIDYKYNSHAMATQQEPATGAPVTLYPPLLQVCVAAPVNGGVKSMQSKPNGQWFPNTNRACWKIPALSYSHDNQGIGSLRARFEVGSGPSSAGAIAAQFSCENSTLSGCDFALSGSGYRVSLIKKRFVSGKYTCEAVDSSSRYALVPGPGDSTII